MKSGEFLDCNNLAVHARSMKLTQDDRCFFGVFPLCSSFVLYDTYLRILNALFKEEKPAVALSSDVFVLTQKPTIVLCRFTAQPTD